MVAGGTRTPWGEWAWEGGLGLLEGGKVDDAPDWLLDRLAPPDGTKSDTKGHRGKVDESLLHPGDLAALRALRRLGGHDPFIPFEKDYIAITRPGKQAGASASIGHIAPGVVKVFSSKWPGLNENGVYDADELAAIADRSTTTEVDDDESSWDPIDLGPAWRGERTRPPAEVFRRDDGVALLPPGLNYLFGDSGDGKSFVALVAALEEIRAGHPPIWVTYEDANEDLVVDRLRMLGASEDEAAALRFIAPQAAMTAGAARIASLAAMVGSRLIVLDSVGEAMAVGGVNEDKDNEVGPWFRQTLRLIHDLNPALSILPIDHSTKSKDNPLFPSGSKRKRSAPTGRAYLLNVLSPFALGAVGYVQLVVAKDRGGLFKRGEIAAEIMLDATATPYRWTITEPRDGDAYSPKLRRRTAAERVLEALGESAVPMTAEQIARIANGPDRTQPGEARIAVSTVQNALTKLARAADVRRTGGERVDGRCTVVRWQFTSPDRDQTETGAA